MISLISAAPATFLIFMFIGLMCAAAPAALPGQRPIPLTEFESLQVKDHPASASSQAIKTLENLSNTVLDSVLDVARNDQNRARNSPVTPPPEEQFTSEDIGPEENGEDSFSDGENVAEISRRLMMFKKLMGHPKTEEYFRELDEQLAAGQLQSIDTEQDDLHLQVSGSFFSGAFFFSLRALTSHDHLVNFQLYH